MLSEGNKLLEIINQYQKPDNESFIVYTDLQCIIEETDGRKNNARTSSTTRVSEHIQSGFSMSTISSFRNRK